jgi:hypothetical protein
MTNTIIKTAVVLPNEPSSSGLAFLAEILRFRGRTDAARGGTQVDLSPPTSKESSPEKADVFSIALPFLVGAPGIRPPSPPSLLSSPFSRHQEVA